MQVTASQYETTLIDIIMPKMFPLARPIRYPVHWQAGFSKSWGLSASVSFLLLHLPLPPPPRHLFNCLALGPFFAWPIHSIVPWLLFAPKPQGNYASYFKINSPDKHVLCKIKNNTCDCNYFRGCSSLSPSTTNVMV